MKADTCDQVRDLLERRFIASLGTVNKDGTIHLVAIWYILLDDIVAMPTSASSRKAENVRLNPTATLMVDERNGESMSGVSISGRARILEGAGARRINHQIHQKYLSEAALEDPEIASIFAGDDIALVLECDSVTRWDMTADIPQLFGGSAYMRGVDI